MSSAGFKKEYLLTFLFFLAVVAFIWLLPLKAPKKEARKITPVPQKRITKAKIAIVLDDFGYSLNNIPALEKVKSPITLAVLPNLAYSAEISRKMNAYGFEIILHMPMEPVGKQPLEKDTILTTMENRQISNILTKNLESIKFAKGISNHMGSKATADLNTMTSIMAELKKRKLYFLDSFVTPLSVGKRTATKENVRFAKRDIFLDNKSDPEYIRGQLNKLKEIADLKGCAIGIGHDRKNTIEVLKAVIPEFEKKGYRFVLVSEVLK